MTGLFSRLGQMADEKLAALLSVSAYDQNIPASGPDPDEQDEIRKRQGGNITPMPYSRPRWYLANIESAMAGGDVGDLQMIGELCRALRRDGMIGGLLSTRTEGLVQLPLRFYGNEAQIDELRSRNGTRSLFSEMFPPSELALLAGDGILVGVGVAELVPVTGRDYPVMIRHDPSYLNYRWNEGRWYFRSNVGLLPITPGDGRWILHTPCGRIAPWMNSAWRALARAYITKEHSWMMRQNYAAKLANPARIATSPQGSSQEQKVSWFEQVLNWGMNTVFHITPGYKVELLELRGQGYKVFAEDMEAADHEIMISLAGQEVTTTGGAGFSNMDLFRSIKSDLIRATGDGLAYTLNTQGIPPWVVRKWGIDALADRAIVEWDTKQPKDQNAEAASLLAIANAISALRREARKDGRRLDTGELYNRFSVPLEMRENDDDAAPESGVRDAVAPIDVAPDVLEKLIEIAKANGLQVSQASLTGVAAALGVRLEKAAAGAVAVAKLDLAPTDVAKCVRMDEVRASQSLGPVGDARGNLLVVQLDDPEAVKAALAPAPAAVDGADPSAPTTEQLDPDNDGLPGEPATDESVQQLADKMTAAGITRCEHGSSNRCRLCGIERVRDFELDADGKPVLNDDGTTKWTVAWRPIPKQQEAA